MRRHGLIAAECAALTGSTPDDDGVAGCAGVARVVRGAYVRTGLRAIAAADDLDDLVSRVGALDLDVDRFRVDLHDPSGRLGRASRDVAVAIADVLDDDPDLSDPRHRLVVVATDGRVALGEVVATADDAYRAHDAKPWTTSSSLDARVARALVNLVPDARSILDPCCGAGSIVLEAASLGLRAIGVDDKAAMAGMTRENLAHLGLEATVERADAREVEHRVDAVVTDLPYGHAIERDDAAVRAILERCAGLAPHGVFVAPHRIDAWLAGAGHRVDAVHEVVKRRGFSRWIHVTSTG